MILKEEKEPIFITGSVRSGTSVMNLALRKGAKIPGYSEGCFIQYLGVFKRTVDTDFERRSHQIKFADIILRKVDKDEFLQSFYNWYENEYNKWSKYSKHKRWIDKTADVGAISAMPSVCKVWPKAKCVYMKRRPIECIESRMKKFPTKSFDTHCTQWSNAMNFWTNSKKEMSENSYVEIDQYEVAMNPEKVTDQLVEFLNIDEKYHKKILKIFKKERPEYTGGNEKKIKSLEDLNLTSEEKEVFMTKCAHIAEEYGWSLEKGEYYIS